MLPVHPGPVYFRHGGSYVYFLEGLKHLGEPLLQFITVADLTQFVRYLEGHATLSVISADVVGHATEGQSQLYFATPA